MAKYRLTLLALAALCCSTVAVAQSEGGLVATVGAEKSVSKPLKLDVEVGMRTRNDFKTMDRWNIGIGADYKFNKWLKANAGYDWLRSNYREKITYTASGDYNHWRPSYWGSRHRLHLSLTGAYKFDCGIKLSLRERWQYTYRPETTTQRWDFDDERWEDHVRGAKGKNQLRSRLQVEYDRKRALLTPFLNVELYHSPGIEKIRYGVGTDIRINKHHALNVFYRFQDQRHTDPDDPDDPDMHYLGIGYKMKF